MYRKSHPNVETLKKKREGVISETYKRNAKQIARVLGDKYVNYKNKANIQKTLFGEIFLANMFCQVFQNCHQVSAEWNLEEIPFNGKQINT